jgi:hypothetical protein
VTPRPTATFTVDGRPAPDGVEVGAPSRLEVVFPAPVRPESVVVTWDGTPLPGGAPTWAPDDRSAVIPTGGLRPYHDATLRVAAGAGASGTAGLRVSPVATIPAGPGSGIDGELRPQTPVMIAIDNSQPARPQSGLDGADLVYEYVSEYAITRFTAVYFKNVPAEVGPVRSCRLINAFLGYAYAGETMCSGLSGGTSVWFTGAAPDARPVPTVVDRRDPGNHFHRSGARAAPYNLYVAGGDAARVRSEVRLPAGAYLVDGPHPDVDAGEAAPAPAIAAHGVAYDYDEGSRSYLRTDHGVQSIDAGGGGSIRVKTVAVLHVASHDAGYIEDESGGAHSIWYSMLGEGPAELYSNGRLVRATWHMGATGQYYYWENHSPLWFSDASGGVIRLNSGLTWIHVVGTGQ